MSISAIIIAALSAVAGLFGLMYKSKTNEAKAEKRRADNMQAINTQNKTEMEKQHEISKAKDDALSVSNDDLDERMRKYDRSSNNQD